MTITLNINPDTLQDEVGKTLLRLNSLTNWNSEKQNLLKDLICLLEKNKYKKLILKEHRYQVGKVGNSFIYEISMTRRGLFSPFRGKSVRVICVASGRFDRTVMVRPI